MNRINMKELVDVENMAANSWSDIRKNDSSWNAIWSNRNFWKDRGVE